MTSPPADAPPATPVVEAPRKRAAWRTFSWVALGALWSLLLGYGLRERYLYDTTPGAAGQTPHTFPTASRLPLAHEHSTLFMFVHPECPCTRASLQELATLLGEAGTRVMPVLVVAPAIAPNRKWDDLPGATVARSIANLQRHDDDGSEAARFGALTSGYVALYDAEGTLQFAGGITGSRGHAGKNVGRATVLRLLRERAAGVSNYAVYGCPFASEGS